MDAALTRLIGQAVEQGFPEKVDDPRVIRAVAVHLTPDGAGSTMLPRDRHTNYFTTIVRVATVTTDPNTPMPPSRCMARPVAVKKSLVR